MSTERTCNPKDMYGKLTFVFNVTAFATGFAGPKVMATPHAMSAGASNISWSYYLIFKPSGLFLKFIKIREPESLVLLRFRRDAPHITPCLGLVSDPLLILDFLRLQFQTCLLNKLRL